MEVTPQIFTAKVMHKRLLPKVNGFTYGMYNVVMPLAKLHEAPIAINRRAVMSFHEKDHGARDGKNLQGWIDGILAQHQLQDKIEHVVLVSLPRIFGYVFNPVSFWFCLGEQKKLRAVLCEVNNTFGETHSYLCAHSDHREIDAQDWLLAEKLFHVSPFMQREGEYQFRFALKENKLGIWIDYFNEDGEKQLLTSLVGDLQPMTKPALRRVFWRYPMVTFKAISLIHWQAIKLLAKGIRYVPKPTQKEGKLSATNNLTKV